MPDNRPKAEEAQDNALAITPRSPVAYRATRTAGNVLLITAHWSCLNNVGTLPLVTPKVQGPLRFSVDASQPNKDRLLKVWPCHSLGGHCQGLKGLCHAPIY